MQSQFCPVERFLQSTWNIELPNWIVLFFRTQPEILLASWLQIIAIIQQRNFYRLFWKTRDLIFVTVVNHGEEDSGHPYKNHTRRELTLEQERPEPIAHMTTIKLLLL